MLSASNVQSTCGSSSKVLSVGMVLFLGQKRVAVFRKPKQN